MREVGNHRSNEIGSEFLANVAEHRLGHAGQRERRNCVGLNVVLGSLDREYTSQSDETHLRGSIICLAEVSENAGGGRCRDDATVTLIAHQHERWLGHMERAL